MCGDDAAFLETTILPCTLLTKGGTEMRVCHCADDVVKRRCITNVVAVVEPVRRVTGRSTT